jgi:hypothetical protein
VRFAKQPAIGVLTIAGPTVRLSLERMQSLASELLTVAHQLAAASSASPFFAKTGMHSDVPASAGRTPIYAP